MRKEIEISMAAIMIAFIMVVMVGSVSAANCEQPREECRENFEADCEAAKDYNCERFGAIYSGCALDVVCGTGYCSYAYADPWCNMPGYVECADPIMEEYRECLKQCNEDAPAREGEGYNARMKRLRDCGNHCWEEAKQKLIACRKEACEAYCREQGSSGGAVVKGVCKCDEIPKETNKPPVAHASVVSDSRPELEPTSHLGIEYGETVILSAEESYDPDGEILNYRWFWDNTKMAAGEVTESRFFFIGEKVVTLEVEDNKGAKSTDTVIITVTEKEDGPKEEKIEDCNIYCQQMLSGDVKGKGIPPKCYCFCTKKGYKLNIELGICEIECDYYCKQRLGEHAIGSNTYPNCKCECERGYELVAKTGKCEETCDLQCKKKFGVGTIGNVADDGECKCECNAPYRWNKDMTECVICNENKICEPYRGERCYNCPDCICKPPYSKCNPDPTKPKAPIGYESIDGCYIPNIESYKREECEKMKTDAEECADAMNELMLFRSNNPTSWPMSPYSYNDPRVGVGTQVHKYLVKMGYVNEKGLEVGHMLQGRLSVDQAFRSYSRARITMYESYCKEPLSSSLDIKPGSNVVGTKSHINMEGPGRIHHVGTPMTVRDKFGYTVFESEFEMEVKKDNTTIINLIEGYAQYYSSVDYSVTELSSGQSIMIDQDGKVSHPIEFDVEKMDKWWVKKDDIYAYDEVPGFELALAITGLLAVAYLLRKKK